MAKDKLYSHILLDRTGSMISCRESTIDAINEYINSLRTDENINARVSLTLFDSQSIDLLWKNKKPKDCVLTDKEFVPRAMTPLNDAIAKTALEIDKVKLRKGEKVAYVILTDGFENASEEYTTEGVKELISDRENKKDWLIIYLGANQDAIHEGGVRGMAAGQTMTYDTENVQAAMTSTISNVRHFASTGEKKAFTRKEREDAVERK